jgi:hypothetical protein
MAGSILAMREAGLDRSFYYHLWDQICFPEDFTPFFSERGVANMVRHWNEVASTWAEAPPALDPMTIRYEELVEPGYDSSDIDAHLGVSTTPSEALGHRTGSTPNQRGMRRSVATRIDRVARSGMKAMGYA